MAKIFGFHDNSACGYYRVTLPLDALAHYGNHQIQTAVGWSELCKTYPIIIGQRIGKPDGALPLWRRLRPGHRLIYETDDDFFTIDEFNFRAKQEHSPSLLDMVEQALAVAHSAVVSTDPLADVIRKYNSDVTVLQNCIDGQLLTLERPHRDRVTLGWAGGDSHLKDWRTLAPHLKRFMKRNAAVELHIIGTNFAKMFKIPSRETDWQDVWNYYCSIDFDIGLAPLDPSLPFNRSKSHIKALEYAALGIPVIATDMEPYRDFVIHGETGFLVRHDHEWNRYLGQLVQDKALREKMGKQAKERAADYTIQHNWRAWEQAYLGS